MGILYCSTSNSSLESEREISRTSFTRSSFRSNSSRCLFEHFQSKVKIHPNRTIEAYQPGMERNIGVLSFGTRCFAGTAKIDAVSGDERPVAIDDEAF